MDQFEADLAIGKGDRRAIVDKPAGERVHRWAIVTTFLRTAAARLEQRGAQQDLAAEEAHGDLRKSVCPGEGMSGRKTPLTLPFPPRRREKGEGQWSRCRRHVPAVGREERDVGGTVDAVGQRL